MSLLAPSSLARMDTLDVTWMHQPITYLALAGLCLVVVLRFTERALSPIKPLVQAITAAAVVAFAAVLALAMLIIAAYMSAR